MEEKNNFNDDLTSLYNYYDKILNCLVINAKTMTIRNKRRGYYIDNFNIENKTDLLLVEIVKIINTITSKQLPILIDCNSFKALLHFFKMKFKLRKSSTKIRIAHPEDINNDFKENLDFVCRDLRFSKKIYENIYETFYVEGIEIPDLR